MLVSLIKYFYHYCVIPCWIQSLWNNNKNTLRPWRKKDRKIFFQYLLLTFWTELEKQNFKSSTIRWLPSSSLTAGSAERKFYILRILNRNIANLAPAKSHRITFHLTREREVLWDNSVQPTFQLNKSLEENTHFLSELHKIFLIKF